MVAVLFVRKDSIYKSFRNCDCYDKERNALNFKGGMPVIAHPPCRAWGRLFYFARPEPGEKNLAVEAVKFVRENGGVLEHPADSKLWRELDMPKGRDIDRYGGWTLSVNQHWFGHKAQKRTWLYIVGCESKNIPEYSVNFNVISHTICSSKKKNGKKEVTRVEREATPEKFAKWLVELAESCR